MAFPFAVINAAKEAVKSHAERPFILGYRLSPEELEEPGITLEDTLAFVNQLKTTGLDYLHISTGNVLQTSMRNTLDMKPVLEYILEAVGGEMPVIGVGSIHTPEQAAEAMKMGLSLVAVGRSLLVDPDWAVKVNENRAEDIQPVIKLSNSEQVKDVALPAAMWDYLTARRGWVPIEE